MKKIFIVLCLVLCIASFNAYAQNCGQDCVQPPSCAALGYKEVINCPDDYVVCPFDSNYKWCKEYTCEDGRYYSSPLKASDGYSCASVSYHGLRCYDCTSVSGN